MPQTRKDPFAKWRTEKFLERPSLAEEALRQGKRTGRALATGTASVADLPNLAALGLHKAGLRKDPEFYPSLGEKVRDKIDAWTDGTLKPRNKTEEWMDHIVEGVAPLGALGKAGKIGRALYAPTKANITGTIGSSIATKAYADAVDDPSLGGLVAASLVGQKAGRGLGHLSHLKNPKNAAALALGKATKFDPEKYAKNADLNLPASMADVSKSPKARSFEKMLSKYPGSNDKIKHLQQNREAAMAHHLGVSQPDNLEGTVQNLPKHLAKEGAEGYHTRASAHYAKRQEHFKDLEDRLIKNRDTVDVSDIIQKLEQERSLSLTPAAQKRFDRTGHGVLLKELKESIPTQNAFDKKELMKQGFPDALADRIIQNLEPGYQKQGIGLYNLNELRSKALQESIETQTPIGGRTPKSKEAAERHGMLASKRHDMVETYGNPTEAHHSKAARKFWAQYKDSDKGTSRYVQKITGSKDDTDAFNKLLGGDGKYLSIARQGLPKEKRKQLFESIVAHLGEKKGRFDVGKFYASFKGLDTPVQQQILKTVPSGATRKHFLDTIDLISGDKKSVEALAKASTREAAPYKWMKEHPFLGTLGAGLGAGYWGGPKAMAAALMGDQALRYGSKLWTNQLFLKRMNHVMKAHTPQARDNWSKLLAKTIDRVLRGHSNQENPSRE